MKHIKKYILLLLIAITASAFVNAGWGRGYRHGYWGRGYRRGYWGRGWGWGVGVPLGIGIAAAASSDGSYEKRRPYRDGMEKKYWTIYNNTGFPILVKTPGYGYKRIGPGKSRNLYRKRSFKLKVKTPHNDSIRFNTQDHFVSISSGSLGSLDYDSWNDED